MTTNARAEHRRRDRAARKGHLDLDGEYGIQPGWFLSMEDFEDARKRSHDMLIKAMGDRRTGGVQWRYWTGDEAKTVLGQLIASGGLDQHEQDVYRRIGAHLREYGGYLIVAMAPGNRRSSG